jgi:hypothetical protein
LYIACTDRFFCIGSLLSRNTCTGCNFKFAHAGDVQRALNGFHGEGRDVTKFVRELAVEYPPAAAGLMARMLPADDNREKPAIGAAAIRWCATVQKVKQMKADGMGPSTIAKALKIGRASVYRALAE